ncbi:MAG: hypothetical protein NVS3B5_19180 [Sphingomicrobium sp.]
MVGLRRIGHEPGLALAEHNLDAVALPVERAIVREFLAPKNIGQSRAEY